MFNPRQQVISRFVEELEDCFFRCFGHCESERQDELRWIAYFALDRAAQSDCYYYNLEHTVNCVSVGQEILLGKRLWGEAVSADDWLHFLAALLCSNLGLTKGLTSDDYEDHFLVGNGSDEIISMGPGSNGATFLPYKIERSQMLVKTALDGHELVKLERLCGYIEHTRFPIPDDAAHNSTCTFGGLIRAALLIGVIADPAYMKKLNALFLDLQEGGLLDVFGFDNPVDFRANYADYYHRVLHPYVEDAVRYLNISPEGHLWSAQLHAHLHAELYNERALGVAREQEG